MSDYFVTMENEFYKIIGQINKKLANIANQTTERKESAISEAQRELNDAESCIKQMEIEVNPLPEPQRRDLQQKVRKCRQEFDETRRKFMTAEDTYLLQKQKDTLMGSRLEGDGRFVTPDSLLTAQNRRLEDAKGTAYTTLQIAGSTQEELHRQSDTMRRNINRLDEANNELSWSNKMVDQMSRRIRQNKILMWSVFGIIGLACVGVVISYLPL